MSQRNSYVSCTVLALIAGALQAQEQPVPRSFNYDCAGGLSGSLKDELYSCREARISDGEIEISALTATTGKRDFEESAWQLSGSVQVSMGTARLRADNAIFVFVANELVSFELTGAPAELTDLIEGRGVAVSGSANLIAFDNRGGTVQLTGNVGFEVDGDEIATSALTYNLRDKSFGTGDVRVTLGQNETSSELAPAQNAEP